jgi:hypothetical protein
MYQTAQTNPNVFVFVAFFVSVFVPVAFLSLINFCLLFASLSLPIHVLILMYFWNM